MNEIIDVDVIDQVEETPLIQEDIKDTSIIEENIEDISISETDISRPFFSIVIPCYNPNKYLNNLLESILNQHMNKNDIEIILVDDQSEEKYDDIINKFKDSLLIVTSKTEYHCCPGNTREKGASIATGQWLTFIDQDDLLIEDTYQKVKDEIINSNEQYYAISNFIETEPETGKILKEHKQARNWCHGKFFNLDNFWKKFNFHFKPNLMSHEDIYISSLVIYYLQLINKDQYLKLDFNTMKWQVWPESTSRKKYNNNKNNYLEINLKDYIKATGYTYLDLYKTDIYKPEYKYWSQRDNFMLNSAYTCLLYCYFYLQSFKFFSKNYIRDNFQYIVEYYNEIKNMFNLTPQHILFFVQEYPNIYHNIRKISYIGVGQFIETNSLGEFLQRLEKGVDE